MPDVTEIDYTTKPPTIIERDFTPEEAAQVQADRAAAEAQAELAAAKAQDTLDAIAHAKFLGFTDAMIAVMYPNLGGNNE